MITTEIVERWAAEFVVPEASGSFAQELVDGTIDHLDEIDQRIASFAQDWTLSRMANVDRNVMRLATYEILSVRIFLDE